MRSVALFIFFVLLTACPARAGVQGTPDVPSSLFLASDGHIESLERLHQRAESQIVENDFDGAIRTYLDILLLEPDDETAYAGMGNCYLLMGQYRNAFDAYQYALSINPQNESAILGTQKIIDPDGVEGMVHPLQVEAEGAVSFKETVFSPELAEQPTRLNLKTEHNILSLPTRSAVVPVSRERLAFSDPLPVPPRKLRRIKSEVVQAYDVAEPREIQKALRNTGFYGGPIDGILGSDSRKAIQEYQTLHEITSDGIVGPITWALLRLYLDQK